MASTIYTRKYLVFIILLAEFEARRYIPAAVRQRAYAEMPLYTITYFFPYHPAYYSPFPRYCHKRCLRLMSL